MKGPFQREEMRRVGEQRVSAWKASCAARMCRKRMVERKYSATASIPPRARRAAQRATTAALAAATYLRERTRAADAHKQNCS